MQLSNPILLHTSSSFTQNQVRTEWGETFLQVDIKALYLECPPSIPWRINTAIHKCPSYSIWHIGIHWASLVAQMVKRLPVMRETQVWFPGQEDPLEKEMATHSSVVAWEIPWIEEPGRLQSIASQKSWSWLSDQITTTAILIGYTRAKVCFTMRNMIRTNWYSHYGEQCGGFFKN